MATNECTKYRDWLRSLTKQWPKYSPISRLLDEPPDKDSSQLTVFDIMGQQIRYQDYDSSNSGWKDYLEQDVLDSRLRIVLVGFSDRNVSRQILDKLGELYDIDPLDYMRHFKESTYGRDRRFEHSWYQTASQTKTTQIGFRPSDHTSVIYPETPTNRARTVIILMSHGLSPDHAYAVTTLLLDRPHFKDCLSPSTSPPPSSSSTSSNTPPQTNVQYLHTVLLSSSPSSLTELADYPHLVALLIVNQFLTHSQLGLRSEINSVNKRCPMQYYRNKSLSEVCNNFPARGLENILFSLNLTRRNIEATCPTNNASPSYLTLRRNLLMDVDSMIQQTLDALARWERHRQTCIDFKAMAFAGLSVRNADSVSLITKLAFLFIPLSFVTSCFGMNLSVMNSGTAPMWAPIVVSAGLFVFALVTWGISRWVERTAKLVYERFQSLLMLCRYWRLLRTDLRAAGLLALFAIEKPPKEVKWLIWVVDLKTTNLNIDKEGLTIHDEETRSRMMHNFLSEIWCQRAKVIHKAVQSAKEIS